MILLFLAVTTSTPPAPARGLWSDIHIGRDSGDYEGLEIRLASPTTRNATVTVCGDGCSAPTMIRIARDRVGFTFALPRRDDADPADSPSRCHARFAGSALAVTCEGSAREEHLRHLVAGQERPHSAPVLEK